MKYYIINENGLKQLADFLRANHKRGEIIADSPKMLRAWADCAEFSLTEGNGASVEIRSFESVHGMTQDFTITDEGLTLCNC
jgi:DNA-binding PadR family transcriptional regulator